MTHTEVAIRLAGGLVAFNATALFLLRAVGGPIYWWDGVKKIVFCNLVIAMFAATMWLVFPVFMPGFS